jgi:hypothetical protein
MQANSDVKTAEFIGMNRRELGALPGGIDLLTGELLVGVPTEESIS